MDKDLAILSERMLTGIASVYGRNSTEYAKAGETNCKPHPYNRYRQKLRQMAHSFVYSSSMRSRYEGNLSANASGSRSFLVLQNLYP